MNPTQDIIVRLLTNIGSRKEVEQYLRHYASVDSQKFAVIRVTGEVLERSLDSLASSLTFLHRVGLYPLVVHGGGPQLDRALVAAGIPLAGEPGMRPMTTDTLAIARRVFHEENLALVEALEALGTRARPFTSGVFRVRQAEDGGLVGRVTGVSDAALTATLRAGHLPIVAPLGETESGQILVVHADAAARALTFATKPHKVIFLNETGGLEDEHGDILSAVNLAEDADRLKNKLSRASARKLAEIAETLVELPPTSSVSITSPEHLAKELFTHGGAGTLVRRGERVNVHPSFDAIDQGKLRRLLEGCFGRRLDEEYFTKKKPFRVYLAESYRATAILTLEDGVPYLDKFAVTTEAQGEGIGGSIWERMRRETTKVFWRARAQNPINAWYAQKADGLVKAGEWTVFYCGLEGFGEIESCVTRALAMPATLREHGAGELAE